MTEKILYNIGEACKILGVSRFLFEKIRHQLPSVDMGTGKLYYTKEALENWVKSKEAQQ